MRAQHAIVLTTALAALGAVGCASTPYESNREAVADSTVTANVTAALVQDPVTRASNISVNTIDGTVELSGFVDSNDQRHEAEHDAQDIAGVRSVRDELRINNGTVVGTADSDAVITQRVQSALAANPDTDASQIKVSTADRIVQLAGFVNSGEERDAADSVASSVQGVRRVENDLRIAPQP